MTHTSLVLFIVVHSLLFGQSARYDTLRYAREHYQSKVTAFKSESKTKGSVVFVGNSLTEFGEWKNLLQDSSIINRGIAGDNTFGILDRLEEVIQRKSTKIFIEAGINDISQNIPIDVITKNLLVIVSRIKKELPTTEVYIYSVLPTNDNVKNEYPDAYNKNHIVRLLNSTLQTGAKRNNFTYINLIETFADREGKLTTKFAREDGLHLNSEGYKVWAKILKSNYLK